MSFPNLRILSTSVICAFAFNEGVLAAPILSSEQFDALSKPGLKLNVVRKEFDLSIVQALKSMQEEHLREFGSTYDKVMVKLVLESAPKLDGDTVPTKAWWDSVCGRIAGASADDVKAGMSPKEIEQVVSKKVAGAKARTLADIDSLLKQLTKEQKGKALPFGIAANCDLNASPSYNWSDPTVVDLSEETDRAGSHTAKVKSIGRWDVKGELSAEAEFTWTLGKASFRGQHEGVKKIIVEADVDRKVTVSYSVAFGIGEHKLELRAYKVSNTTASNNPDLILWEFTED